MASNRNVKIVATLGPSTNTRCQIKALSDTGANVFRINLSHGSHSDVKKLHQHIRSVEEEIQRPIAILADLQGPKIRCGRFKGSEAILKQGAKFTFDLKEELGDNTRVHLPHPEIFLSLEPGCSILVNDGLIRLIVDDCSSEHAVCSVVTPGKISDCKGVNIPSVVLQLSSLSEKDRIDLAFVDNLGVDWVALSFVQRPEDVLEARNLLGKETKIVSKIEKPAAIEVFDEILRVSDGIMVARGDLGVELPIQKLPAIQKRLIRKCRETGKPVIVATQMLESMINAPVPTRAEVSDVATAIYEGADAIMLSGETAAGQHPIEAVKTMVNVAEEVEGDLNYRDILKAGQGKGGGVYKHPLTIAAREIAEGGDIQAICCFTQSGSTALSAARERPCVPILALTPEMKTARHLCLVWGLRCRIVKPVTRFKNAVLEAIEAVNSMNLASNDHTIVVTAGLPIYKSGSTNILRLAKMDGSDLSNDNTVNIE